MKTIILSCLLFLVGCSGSEYEPKVCKPATGSYRIYISPQSAPGCAYSHPYEFDVDLKDGIPQYGFELNGYAVTSSDGCGLDIYDYARDSYVRTVINFDKDWTYGGGDQQATYPGCFETSKVVALPVSRVDEKGDSSSVGAKPDGL